jgi:glycerol-3-phosphate dehydrogenase
VRGVAARDGLSGQSTEIRARMTINAAGPAADALVRGAGLSRAAVPQLRAVNLVLRRAVVRDTAVGARHSGRYLFCVPWRDRSIVGTAYAPEATSGRELAVAFLAEAARAFPWAALRAADVALVHEGRVPGGPEGLWARSRVIDHADDGVPGLLTLVAAKYTTARAVAQTAIDHVLRDLGRAPVASRSATTALPEARALAGTLEERTRHAVRDEMALSLGDAVLRRLDLGTAGAPAAADVDVVARVMAGELGWDLARAAGERAALAAFYEKRRIE